MKMDRQTPMAAAASCGLCGATDLETLDRVLVAELARLYERLLGSAVHAEFEGHAAAELLYVRCRRCDLRLFTPPLIGSPALYARLQTTPLYYQDEKPEFAIAARHAAPGDRVLDVGCGQGAFSRFVDAARYTGLELNPEAQAQASAAGRHVLIETIESHAGRNPAAYDMVTLFQVLEHVPAPRALLAHAYACLKPGGRLIVSVPSENSYLRFCQDYILNLPPHHATRWSDEALCALAREFGLAMLELTHESLRDAHQREYLATVCDLALARFLGIGHRPLLDRSLGARIRRRLAHRCATFLAPGISPHDLRPRGHTVTAVYRIAAAGSESVDPRQRREKRAEGRPIA
jgi:2-polyprenyl-3-methyl-5-hydroxy-6-metoxy-1,4-benzoquinol methylase